MVGAHHRVDGLLLRLDVRVAQHLAQQADVDVAVEARERGQRRLADELVRVLELRLQCLGHLRPVEARQDVDDVHARDRVLALEPADQFRHQAASAMSATMRNRAAFSVGSWL